MLASEPEAESLAFAVRVVCDGDTNLACRHDGPVLGLVNVVLWCADPLSARVIVADEVDGSRVQSALGRNLVLPVPLMLPKNPLIPLEALSVQQETPRT